MYLVAILGPTCSGKSDLAIHLAEHLSKDLILANSIPTTKTDLSQVKTPTSCKNCPSSKNCSVWVIGCDSRQIYRHLDLGTGKIPGQWQEHSLGKIAAINYSRFISWFLQAKFEIYKNRLSAFKKKHFEYFHILWSILANLTKENVTSISTLIDEQIENSTKKLNYQAYYLARRLWLENKLESFFPCKQVYLYADIPHFFIDYVEPKKRYSLLEYLQDWEIFSNFVYFLPKTWQPQLLVLTGGTGLFAKAILQEYRLPLIDEQWQGIYQHLKQQLELLDLKTLQTCYREFCAWYQFLAVKKEKEFLLDLESSSWPGELNADDRQNPRRLQNWLLKALCSYLPSTDSWLYPKFTKKVACVLLPSLAELETKIIKRLENRIQAGLLQEVQNLLKQKMVSTQRLRELGLEYRLTLDYLEQKLPTQEWLEKLFLENRHYAKRQYTWFNKELKDGHLSKIENLSDLLDFLDKNSIKLECT